MSDDELLKLAEVFGASTSKTNIHGRPVIQFTCEEFRELLESTAQDGLRYALIRRHSRNWLADAGVDLNWHGPTPDLDAKIDAAMEREKDLPPDE